MPKQDLRKVKKLTKKFFEKIDSDIEVEVSQKDEESIEIMAKMDDPETLIGENGKTLKKVEKLLRLMIGKNLKEKFYVNLDINDYRKKKREYLQQKAREAADEVALTGVEKKMPALPAYERRIIHVELSNREDVETESEGEEPDRYVVIKPA